MASDITIAIDVDHRGVSRRLQDLADRRLANDARGFPRSPVCRVPAERFGGVAPGQQRHVHLARILTGMCLALDCRELDRPTRISAVVPALQPMVRAVASCTHNSDFVENHESRCVRAGKRRHRPQNAPPRALTRPLTAERRRGGIIGVVRRVLNALNGQ